MCKIRLIANKWHILAFFNLLLVYHISGNCTEDQQYYMNKPDCKNTCENYENPAVLCTIGKPGCICKENLVLRKDGQCVPPEICPEGPICGENEEQTDCAKPAWCNTCEIRGNCKLRGCTPGCDCKPGFYRDSNGRCIDQFECPGNSFPSSDFDVSSGNIREKRNLICFFGLTNILSETLFASLIDVTHTDTVSIDDAWDGQLHDGHLKGLSTLTNLTAFKVFCDEEDMVVFSTTLRMKDAEIWYKWIQKVIFKFKGSVWVKVKEVDFDLGVRVNTTDGWDFEVTNSMITKLDDFEIGFSGLGILNPVVRTILETIWKLYVSKKIGLLIKESLTKKLETISSSLEWMTFL